MQTPILMRAGELARTGEYDSIEQIEKKLSAEGYERVSQYLHGPTTRRQLNNAIRGRRTQANPR